RRVLAARRYQRATLPLVVGFSALLLLVGGLGFWSIHTKLAGAVVAAGLIEVESNRQVIQHPDGGVVGDILSKNGESVLAGQTLIRFDDTLLRSELVILDGQLAELSARRARLIAERDGASEIRFDDALLVRAARDADVMEQVDGQQNLFEARRSSAAQEAEQLGEQISQSRAEISGAEAQLQALQIQLDLFGTELRDQQTLLKKGLAQSVRVSALQRERADLLGGIGGLEANIARIKGEIAALNIEILRLETTRREEAIATLRDVQYQQIELAERRLGIVERLDRLDIRAPVSGVIYGSSVFAVRSVVQAGAPIMYVIPQDQPLVIVGRVDPVHIDQVYLGQPAGLRFSAFEQRVTPELSGNITTVSADALTDDVTGQTYYRVQVLPGEGEMEKLGENTVLPGMPVEIFIKTDERTPLSYLTKPLTDYFSRSMRG
ncbi:MAG: HlyD family type I secretion periplasmic adaptor subunit, partial [Roseibium sp.]